MPGAPVIDESLLLIEDDMTSYAYASPYMFVPCIVLVTMQSTSLSVYESIPTRFNDTLETGDAEGDKKEGRGYVDLSHRQSRYDLRAHQVIKSSKKSSLFFSSPVDSLSDQHSRGITTYLGYPQEEIRRSLCLELPPLTAHGLYGYGTDSRALYTTRRSTKECTTQG